MPQSSPRRSLLLLWLAACGLAAVGLGALPLRDWDEGIVARVALELSRREGAERLLPTLWGSPYLNKPPGLHALIALVLPLAPGGGSAAGSPPPEWLVRLVPALLASLVVPLSGLLQWRLRPGDRAACLATAGIMLTLLPVARHGRLAMLDGSQLSAMALLWWLLAALRGDRSDRWRCLGAGLACSAMLLLKAPLLVPALAAALLPLLMRRGLAGLRRPGLLPWLGLGLLPGLGWHLWHGLNRGRDALWLWGGDGAGRVLLDAGEGSDLGWRVPVLEVLEGGWPWLVLWPFGLLWAWRCRRERWGAWALSLQIVMAMAILPLRTQLPWYSHPLWLPFALLCAPPLAWLVRGGEADPPAAALLRRVPMLWLVLGGLLLLAAPVVGLSGIDRGGWLAAIALCAGAGWLAGGLQLRGHSPRRRSAGAVLLALGNLAALAVLFRSPLWLWELQETWAVQPPAALARTVPGPVRLLGQDERPSLNWYAMRRIRRAGEDDDGAAGEGAPFWLLVGPGDGGDRPTSCRPATRTAEQRTAEAAARDGWRLLRCGAGEPSAE